VTKVPLRMICCTHGNRTHCRIAAQWICIMNPTLHLVLIFDVTAAHRPGCLTAAAPAPTPASTHGAGGTGV
jgi:hypothetical protein